MIKCRYLGREFEARIDDGRRVFLMDGKIQDVDDKQNRHKLADFRDKLEKYSAFLKEQEYIPERAMKSLTDRYGGSLKWKLSEEDRNIAMRAIDDFLGEIRVKFSYAIVLVAVVDFANHLAYIFNASLGALFSTTGWTKNRATRRSFRNLEPQGQDAGASSFSLTRPQKIKHMAKRSMVVKAQRKAEVQKSGYSPLFQMRSSRGFLRDFNLCRICFREESIREYSWHQRNLHGSSTTLTINNHMTSDTVGDFIIPSQECWRGQEGQRLGSVFCVEARHCGKT